MALRKLSVNTSVVLAGSLLQVCSQRHNLKTPYFLKIASGTVSFMEFCVDTRSLPSLLHYTFRKKQCCDHWRISISNWIKRDQLDVTCFIILLFNARHVSDVNTSILRSLRLIWWVIAWVVWFWFDVCWCCVVVVWYPYAGWSTTQWIMNEMSTTIFMALSLVITFYSFIVVAVLHFKEHVP